MTLESPDKLIVDMKEAAAALVALPDGHRLSLAVLQGVELINTLNLTLETVTKFTERAVGGSPERLMAALEPFAREASNWADSVPDDYRSLCFEPGAKQANPGSETAFTVGDLRRALRVVAAGDRAADG